MFYLTFTLMLYRVMKTRSEPLRCRPFKTILLAYNFICVLLAGYVVWGIGTKLLSPSPYKFVCNKTVMPGTADDVNGDAAFMAHVFWVFFCAEVLGIPRYVVFYHAEVIPAGDILARLPPLLN